MKSGYSLLVTGCLEGKALVSIQINGDDGRELF